MKPARWFHGLEVARRFAADLRPHRARLGAACLLSLFSATCELLRPWPIQWIFDGALTRAAAERAHGIVWTGVGALLAITVAKALLDYVRTLSVAGVAQQFTRGLRYRLFAHMVRLSPLFHARHKSGDLLVRVVGDAPVVGTMMVESSVEILTRALVVSGTLAVMFVLDPLLALVLVASFPLVGWIVRAFSIRIRVTVGKQRGKEGDLADYLHEAIAATPTIQSLDGASHVVRRFARDNRTSARAGLRAKRIAARLASSVELTLGLALAATLALGSLRVLDGRLSPGELLVFLSYVRSLVKPMRSASKHADQVAKGVACGERILSVLDECADVSDDPTAPDAPEQPATLAFDDVSFRYADGAQALRGLTCSFRRGELSALVGGSGVGKSTAAALAMRLFDPERGTVLFDGLPLRSFNLSSVRRRAGVCLQESVLFGESIRENLLLGRPEATEEELWVALRLAGAAPFVSLLAEGIDTPLGSNGVGLSGGQRGRIALARTLLRETPVLIVDEPFAGLDRSTAQEVSRTLHDLARERVVIVIAHDLEDLERFDHVVFLDDGRLAAEGTHAELSRLASYRRIVRTSTEILG